MAPRITIRVPVPKIRKPVQKKCNTTMKSKRDYTRKRKHKNGDNTRRNISEE